MNWKHSRAKSHVKFKCNVHFLCHAWSSSGWLTRAKRHRVRWESGFGIHHNTLPPINDNDTIITVITIIKQCVCFVSLDEMYHPMYIYRIWIFFPSAEKNQLKAINAGIFIYIYGYNAYVLILSTQTSNWRSKRKKEKKKNEPKKKSVKPYQRLVCYCYRSIIDL